MPSSSLPSIKQQLIEMSFDEVQVDRTLTHLQSIHPHDQITMEMTTDHLISSLEQQQQQDDESHRDTTELQPKSNSLRTQQKDISSVTPEQNDSTAGQNLKCTACGKVFPPDGAAATLHANKTGHDDFQQTTEATTLTNIQTPEQLAALLAERRAQKTREEETAQREAELKRRMQGKQILDAKAAREEQERLAAVEARRREVEAERAARARVLAAIEADKQARREKLLASTEGQKNAVSSSSASSSTALPAALPVPSELTTVGQSNVCTIQVRVTATGKVMIKEFAKTDKVSAVMEWCIKEGGCKSDVKLFLMCPRVELLKGKTLGDQGVAGRVVLVAQ